MGEQQTWGVLCAAWIIIAAIPYTYFTVRLSARDDPRFYTFLKWWIGGFLALLLLNQAGLNAFSGFLWTMIYGAILLRRYKVMSLVGRIKIRQRPFRFFLVISAIWLTMFQAYAMVAGVYEIYSGWDATQIIAINALPLFAFLLGSFGWEWVANADAKSNGEN